MTDSRMDERLDRAIDRAVKDIMSADPPAGLRRRVLERLDERPARSALFTWRPAFAAVALAAVVIAGVVLFRSDAPPAPAIQTNTGTVATAQPPAAPPVDPAPTPATPPAAVAAAAPAPRRPFRPTQERIAIPPIKNVFGTPGDRVVATTVETGDPPAADTDAAPGLSIAPLAAPAPIVVAPLVVPPLAIPPIDINRPPGGTGRPPR